MNLQRSLISLQREVKGGRIRDLIMMMRSRATAVRMVMAKSITIIIRAMVHMEMMEDSGVPKGSTWVT